MDTTQNITLNDVRSAIGNTWFDVIEEDDHFSIESREHGDVGEETYGDADLEEGRRILKLLRSKFPLVDFDSSLDVCDEWVSLDLNKSPRDPKERAKLVNELLFRKLLNLTKNLVLGSIDEKHHGYVSVSVEGDTRLIENASFAQLRITTTYGSPIKSKYPRDYAGTDYSECYDILSPALDNIPTDDLGAVKWGEEAPDMREVGFGSHKEGELIFTNKLPIAKLRTYFDIN